MRGAWDYDRVASSGGQLAGPRAVWKRQRRKRSKKFKSRGENRSPVPDMNDTLKQSGLLEEWKAEKRAAH